MCLRRLRCVSCISLRPLKAWRLLIPAEAPLPDVISRHAPLSQREAFPASPAPGALAARHTRLRRTLPTEGGRWARGVLAQHLCVVVPLLSAAPSAPSRVTLLLWYMDDK
jgi:hypothetical protein